MKNILIFGGSGLLGSNFANYLKHKYNVTIIINKNNINIKGVRSINFDIINNYKIEVLINEVSPNLIINCAGIANVEKCEINKEIANKINTIFPELLSKFSRKYNIKFIHISTDHLYDGNNSFRKEIDSTSPQNHYALSKLNADIRVIKSNSNSIIIRTNFFGKSISVKPSFSDFIIKSLTSSNKICLFSDMFYTPIHMDVLIIKIMELYENNSKGIFNVVSSERLSKYEFGKKISKIFQLNDEFIIKGKLSEQKKLVRRPYDLSLSNEKLNKILGSEVEKLENQILRLKVI